MAAKTAKKVTEEKKTTTKAKTTTAKKTTAKKTSKAKIIDTVAEVVEEEPKIEVEVQEVNKDQEVFEKITERFRNLGDTEKSEASKIFESTKEQLKDSYSEENGALIAAAVADAALTVMAKIQREAIRRTRMAEAAEAHNKKKEDRLARRKEREEARLTKIESRSTARAARKERLGLSN